MADPLRLKVMKALTAALQQITPANGYTFDLSEAVFRGRLMYGDDDPLPMVSILEPPVAPDQLPQPVDGAVSNGDWDILIQGFVEDDPDNPTDPAHVLMAEVKKCLAAVKAGPETTRRATGVSIPTLGLTQITKLQVGAGTVRPADEVSAKAYFWLNLVFALAEDLTNPYE